MRVSLEVNNIILMSIQSNLKYWFDVIVYSKSFLKIVWLT